MPFNGESDKDRTFKPYRMEGHRGVKKAHVTKIKA